MRSSPRCARPASASIALGAALACGCASRSPRQTSPPPGTGSDVVVSSNGWLNGTLERADQDADSDTGARAASSNVALKPSSPWLGTLGLRQMLFEDYEFGCGFCVPSPFESRLETASQTDRARELGVGIWLKLEF